MRFFRKVKYVDYSAMVLDEKIGKEVSKVVDKNTKLIILRNHGNIIIADSLEELQHLTFHFEKCCEIQLKVMNSGYDFNTVKNEIALKTSTQHSQFGPVGKMSWEALIKEIKKINLFLLYMKVACDLYTSSIKFQIITKKIARKLKKNFKDIELINVQSKKFKKINQKLGFIG